MTTRCYVHDELKPAGTFADLKHLKGRQGHQHRARLPAAPGRCRQGLRRSRARVRAHLPHPEGPASAVRAVSPDRRLQGQRRHDLQRRAGTFVRAHRDRAAARLAGEQGADQGAVSRLGLRRQALHQARSAGAGALHDRAAAGEDRAHDGRNVLPDHQAPEHVPHQERRRQERQRSSPANARCSGTAAPMPISARA